MLRKPKLTDELRITLAKAEREIETAMHEATVAAECACAAAIEAEAFALDAAHHLKAEAHGDAIQAALRARQAAANARTALSVYLRASRAYYLPCVTDAPILDQIAEYRDLARTAARDARSAADDARWTYDTLPERA